MKKSIFSTLIILIVIFSIGFISGLAKPIEVNNPVCTQSFRIIFKGNPTSNALVEVYEHDTGKLAASCVTNEEGISCSLKLDCNTVYDVKGIFSQGPRDRTGVVTSFSLTPNYTDIVVE